MVIRLLINGITIQCGMLIPIHQTSKKLEFRISNTKKESEFLINKRDGLSWLKTSYLPWIIGPNGAHNKGIHESTKVHDNIKMRYDDNFSISFEENTENLHEM